MKKLLAMFSILSVTTQTIMPISCGPTRKKPLSPNGVAESLTKIDLIMGSNKDDIKSDEDLNDIKSSSISRDVSDKINNYVKDFANNNFISTTIVNKVDENNYKLSFDEIDGTPASKVVPINLIYVNKSYEINELVNKNNANVTDILNMVKINNMNDIYHKLVFSNYKFDLNSLTVFDSISTSITNGFSDTNYIYRYILINGVRFDIKTFIKRDVSNLSDFKVSKDIGYIKAVKLQLNKDIFISTDFNMINDLVINESAKTVTFKEGSVFNANKTINVNVE